MPQYVLPKKNKKKKHKTNQIINQAARGTASDEFSGTGWDKRVIEYRLEEVKTEEIYVKEKKGTDRDNT